MTTKVELRFNDDNKIECDWGTFGDEPLIHWGDNTGWKFRVEPVNPLILIGKDFADGISDVNQLVAQVTRFHQRDGRRFMTLAAENGTWTWELFDAHWFDGEPCNVVIGRWPDR